MILIIFIANVTARSDLCPIRVQWLQAVFMRLLVFQCVQISRFEMGLVYLMLP